MDLVDLLLGDLALFEEAVHILLVGVLVVLDRLKVGRELVNLDGYQWLAGAAWQCISCCVWPCLESCHVQRQATQWFLVA